METGQAEKSGVQSEVTFAFLCEVGSAVSQQVFLLRPSVRSRNVRSVIILTCPQKVDSNNKIHVCPLGMSQFWV